MRNSLLVGLLLSFLSGCSKDVATPSEAAPKANSEDEAKALFTSLQEAIKARDGEKIFALLDKDTQAAADHAATSIRDRYAKATPAEQGNLARAHDVTGDELALLTGAGYMTLKAILHEHDLLDVPESTFKSVDIKGEKATLHYVEANKTKEKFSLVHQDGKWKLALKISKDDK